MASGAGDGQDRAAGTSRTGIQGFEVPGRLVEGAEQTGDTGPQMSGRKSEEELNTARPVPWTATPALPVAHCATQGGPEHPAWPALLDTAKCLL